MLAQNLDLNPILGLNHKQEGDTAPRTLVDMKPSRWVLLLLLLAGDVETNPGPPSRAAYV